MFSLFFLLLFFKNIERQHCPGFLSENKDSYLFSVIQKTGERLNGTSWQLMLGLFSLISEALA